MTTQVDSVMKNLGDDEHGPDLEPGLLMLVLHDELAPRLVAAWQSWNLGTPDQVIDDAVLLGDLAGLLDQPDTDRIIQSIRRCEAAGVIQRGGSTDLGRLWIRAMARRELDGRARRGRGGRP